MARAFRILSTTALASAIVLPLPSGASDSHFFSGIDYGLRFEGVGVDVGLASRLSAITSADFAKAADVATAQESFSKRSLLHAVAKEVEEEEQGRSPLQDAISRYLEVKARTVRGSQSSRTARPAARSLRAMSDMHDRSDGSAAPPAAIGTQAVLIIENVSAVPVRVSDLSDRPAPLALQLPVAPALRPAAATDIGSAVGRPEPTNIGELLKAQTRGASDNSNQFAIKDERKAMAAALDPAISRMARGAGAFSSLVSTKIQPAQAAPEAAQAGPEPALSPRLFEGRLVTRIAGIEVGAVEFQQAGGEISVKLGSLLDMVSARIPAEDLARLRTSSSAEIFLPLAQLKDAGLPIAYDPVYDEITIGGGPSPDSEAKSHIDQIAPQQAGPSRTMIEQIP